ncbi:MAG: hypothetical protein LIO86_13820 [Lachnospiraceae bacterium]|nr:hypothetical protein [Lachnospiraceae bacterium]
MTEQEMHRMYIHEVVQEMYPRADLGRDVFLIIQSIIALDQVIRDEKEAEVTCMVDLYERNQEERTALYTVPVHPFQHRGTAIAGSRYGAKRIPPGMTPLNFAQQLLRIEAGKKVTDIGLVIHMKSYEELKEIETVRVIWDYDVAATSMLYAVEFEKPEDAGNCYLLKSDVPHDWDRVIPGKPRVYLEEQEWEETGSDEMHLFCYDFQKTGLPHYVHYYRKKLKALPLGADMEIAGNSVKYRKWVRKRGGEI